MKIGRVILLPLLALGMALGAVACDDEEETAVQQAEEEGTGDLIVGDTATISGEVERRVAPNAFTMGADETLVLSAQNPDVEDNDEVRVTGKVVRFIIADVERDYGLDFDDDLFVEFRDELAVVADSVTIIGEE